LKASRKETLFSYIKKEEAEMPSKVQFYAQMADQAVKQITGGGSVKYYAQIKFAGSASEINRQ